MPSTGRLGTMHFRLEKQVTFIQGHGQQVLVWPVLQCPCLLDDKQFNPVCPVCHGTGRFYPPDAAYSTTLLLAQEDSERTYLEAGTWTHGIIRATVLPDVRLYERDKIRLLDVKDNFNDEVLTRGIDDTVRFTAGVSLSVVADRDRVYRSGIDYVLEPPSTIAWLPDGQSPAFMGQYACRYEAFPEFLVVNDSPRLRVEYHVPQAQEVVLMRLDKISEDA
jgi:hypothetical protein